MGFVDRETEKNILDGLAKRDPEIAEEVKNLLFVFEDIINLDDRAIQRILKEVDGKDLALALKTANEELLRAHLQEHVDARRRDAAKKTSKFSARSGCAKSARRSRRSSTSFARSKRTARSSSRAAAKTKRLV